MCTLYIFPFTHPLVVKILRLFQRYRSQITSTDQLSEYTPITIILNNENAERLDKNV